jgi:hypothetical protein
MRLTRETPVSRVSPCLSGAEDAVAAAVRQLRNPALKRRDGARFRAARLFRQCSVRAAQTQLVSRSGFGI